MATNPSMDMPEYVKASGFQHIRLTVEAYRAYWQGCNDGDAAWTEILPPEPKPLFVAPIDIAPEDELLIDYGSESGPELVAVVRGDEIRWKKPAPGIAP